MALQKTPVSILHEVLTKKGTSPKFECTEKTGLQHKPMFKFKVSALNVSVEAVAPTKQQAKQDAANLLLQRLKELDFYDGNDHLKGAENSVPTAILLTTKPHSKQTQAASPTECQKSGTHEIPHQEVKGVPPNKGVLFLEYLCQKYQLPVAPQYTLIEEMGPPHAKLFTVQVVLGIHKASATFNTKKQARQIAATQLFLYLNENLLKIRDLAQNPSDVQKEEKEKKEKSEAAAKRYCEFRMGPSNVSQMSVDEQKLAFKKSIGIKNRIAALEILNKYVNIRDPERVVEEALHTLGLKFEWQALPTVDNRETHILQITSTQATAAILPLNSTGIPSCLRGATAMEAITYLKDMLS